MGFFNLVCFDPSLNDKNIPLLLRYVGIGVSGLKGKEMKGTIHLICALIAVIWLWRWWVETNSDTLSLSFV